MSPEDQLNQEFNRIRALEDQFRQWGMDSGIPPKEVSQALARIKAEGMSPLTKDGMIRLRAELMFKKLDQMRILNVQAFNSALFNQWFILKWVLWGDSK